MRVLVELDRVRLHLLMIINQVHQSAGLVELNSEGCEREKSGRTEISPPL